MHALSCFMTPPIQAPVTLMLIHLAHLSSYMNQVSQLVGHHSTAVRAAAVSFIAAAARALPTVDVVAQLSPLVLAQSGHLLCQPAAVMRDEQLLSSLLEGKAYIQIRN